MYVCMYVGLYVCMFVCMYIGRGVEREEGEDMDLDLLSSSGISFILFHGSSCCSAAAYCWLYIQAR